MKKIIQFLNLKKIMPAMVVFAVLVTVFSFSSYDPYNELSVLTPENAQAALVAGTALNTGENTAAATNVNLECNIWVNGESNATVNQGGSAVITWQVEGYGQVTLNGNPVANTGSLTVNNIQTNTIYTIRASYDDGNGFTANCNQTVRVYCIPTPPPVCESFTASQPRITPGQTVTLDWITRNANSASINQGIGNVPVPSGSRPVSPTVTTTYTLTVLGANNTSDDCEVTIIVTPPDLPLCVSFTPEYTTITRGESVTLSWVTRNATQVSISGLAGPFSLSGSRTVSPTVSTTYTLTATGANGETDTCHARINVSTPEPLTPACTLTASQYAITPGQSVTLNWTTQNAQSASISQFGAVTLPSGSRVVSPAVTTTYILLVTGTNGQTINCDVTITVSAVPAPVCPSFTASPISGAPGSQRTLTWSTQNAVSAFINNGVGSVATSGPLATYNVSPNQTTTYTLTVFGTNNQQTTCTRTVEVVTPTQLTCENNVTFSASPTSIRRGNSSTLTWNTNGVTSVSFDNGISANGLSGSLTVEPSNTTTYRLTASNGTSSVTCPVTVTVTTGGGGGGGSPSPRCELSISKSRISLGQSVKLTWESSNATGLTLEDKTARRTLVDTDGLSVRDREKLLDDDLTVSPRRDTTYVLTVTRGSKERTCTVNVKVGDNVVVTQVRDQQPLVAGISLTQVPYTGFEAGPILTFLFYLLLMAWALYIAYILVIKRDTLGGLKLAGVNNDAEPIFHDEYVSSKMLMSQPTKVEPAMSFMPANLPVAPVVVGYANLAAQTSDEDKSIRNLDEDEATMLENYAHARKVLISSDAIRHFVATTNSVTERTEALDQVIAAAKEKFPTEDGWVVLNEKRMQDLCVICSVNQAASKSETTFIPSVVPTGAGSLAEAIVTGNIVAAYEMIGHRPMFALADAAADLDAVYRLRRGGKGSVSELLMKETASLSDEQILSVIAALTGALDGVYTDEAAAVKMSIMKAIKVVA